MLKNRTTHSKTPTQVVGMNDGSETPNEDTLRLRRELVNAAIEAVGYDPIKIEQYLNRKNVA